MCGIVGFSGSFELSQLQSGLDAIAHRGPDDSGIYTNLAAGIGLGHRRLAKTFVKCAGGGTFCTHLSASSWSRCRQGGPTPPLSCHPIP